LIDDDLAICRERIDRVPEDWYYETLSIAPERHRALNWLLGFARLYSEVMTHT
jgi:hypothetical protein